MIETEKYEELANQYSNLIYKIANQYRGVSNESFEDLVGYSQLGFVEALRDYSEEKSNGQSFSQYAAYRMRNMVLDGINNNSRTIKVSAYNQSKIADGQLAPISMTSLDTSFDGEDVYTDHIIEIGVEDSSVEEGDTFKKLYSTIEANFPKIHCEILYKRYGLNGYECIPCGEIAEEYNISRPRVSTILKNIYTFIQKNEELCDMLRELMSNM